MNRRTFLAAASSAVASSALAAPVPKPTPVYDLLVVEFAVEPGKAVVNGKRLVRVRVADGTAAKPVMVAKLGDELFTPTGAYRLHTDCYVLTWKAAVIDLTTDKVVHQPAGAELLAADGGRVLYRVDGPKAKAGVFAFDLAKQTAAKLDDPGVWGVTGTRSPDGTRVVAPGRAGDLVVYSAGTDPVSLGRGYRVDFSPLSSVFSPPPVLWLDDKRVLTQTANGRLVAVDVADGKQGEVIDAAAKKEVISLPRLWRDAEGNILYDCDAGVSRIDLKAGKAKEYDWHQLGHGFEASVAADPTDGHTFRHNGKEIGKGFGDVLGAAAAPGLLAYVGWPQRDSKKAHVRSLDDDETRVWCASAGKWLTPPLKAESLVGWVKG